MQSRLTTSLNHFQVPGWVEGRRLLSLPVAMSRKKNVLPGAPPSSDEELPHLAGAFHLLRSWVKWKARLRKALHESL
jgi:hypothetical protein